MINHPFAGKGKPSNQSSPLKITPSNSPSVRNPSRSPIKTTISPPALALEQVIGTTTASPSGFSCHEPSRRIALCAGSTAVLARFDEEYRIHQRFYRAAPTAVAANIAASIYGSPTHPATPERRRHSLAPRASIAPFAGPGSPSRELSEHDAFKTWTSRKRIKTVSCVAISPDGKFLAVGETGYNPRVLIFSTSEDALTLTPLSISAEHSSGIRNVAFSPDGKYLASLGDVNDGFVFVFSFNRKTGSLKVQSTNKCTAWVRDMTWFGTNLVTVGTRHVKVWRLPERHPQSPVKSARQRLDLDPPPSPSSQPLSGRNVILGKLANSNFTCVVSISSTGAILCSEDGAICHLETLDGRQELRLVKQLEFGIFSVAVSAQKDMIWFGSSNLRFSELKLSDLISFASATTPADAGSPTTQFHSIPLSDQLLPSADASIIGVGILAESLVYLDSKRNIRRRDVVPIAEGTKRSKSHDMLASAHAEPIEGVQLMQDRASALAFYTWSREGNVRFWNSDGSMLRSEVVQLETESADEGDLPNELKCLQTSPGDRYIISGDRLGVVSIVSFETWAAIHCIRAHGSEVTGIAIEGNADVFLLATSSRDRTIQLFEKTSASLNLIQTMDDHVGSVSGVLFVDNGDRLISFSSDRTIVIRQRFTKEDSNPIYSSQRVITLKASPVAMVSFMNADSLLVSTMDRCVLLLDLTTGAQTHSLKTSDLDDNDSVVLNSLAPCWKEGNERAMRALVGLSSTDKSIRVYDYVQNTLLASEFGHTEGVTALVLDKRRSDDITKLRLISTGLDGIIMIWSLNFSDPMQAQEWSQPSFSTPEPSKTDTKESIASRTPLRRLLSKSDLSDYTRFDPVSGTSTSPARESSPTRVRKRTSTYGLSSQNPCKSKAMPDGSPTAPTAFPHPTSYRSRSPTISEETSSSLAPHNSDQDTGLQSEKSRSSSPSTAHPKRSPTISEELDSGLKTSESPSQQNKDTEDPPANSRPQSLTPRATSTSISDDAPAQHPPSHLRPLRAASHALRPSRSASNLHPSKPAEFGTLDAASESAARMLRTYRNKIADARAGTFNAKILGEVRRELEETLDVLNSKMGRKEEDENGRVREHEEAAE